MTKAVSNKENVEFAVRIKMLRSKKGLSQSEVADAIGIHKINYGRYERGESKPTTESLTKLAEFFSVSSDYLLEGETQDAAIANLEDEDLLRMFSKIEKFSPKNKEAIKIVIDALITKEQFQEMAKAEFVAK